LVDGNNTTHPLILEVRSRFNNIIPMAADGTQMSTMRKKSGAKAKPGGGSAELTASKFLALADAEKERIYQEIDRKSTRQLLAGSEPLSPARRARWKNILKNLGGRPKLGKHGTEIVSVTVEKELLRQANAYAKANGLKRSQLFSRGLRLAIGAGPD